MTIDARTALERIAFLKGDDKLPTDPLLRGYRIGQRNAAKMAEMALGMIEGDEVSEKSGTTGGDSLEIPGPAAEIDENSDDFVFENPLDALSEWVVAWFLWDPETGKVLSPLEHDKEFLDSWREHSGESKAAMARAVEVQVELTPISTTWTDPSDIKVGL